MGLRKFLDMIRGKEKSQGDTENPLVPITKLPLLVVSYIWIVLLSQLMSQYWFIAINKSPYFIHILLVVCVCVCVCVFNLSQDPMQILYLFCLLRLLLAVTVSQTFLFWMILRILKSVNQEYCRYLSLDLLMFSSWLDWGYWFGE